MYLYYPPAGCQWGSSQNSSNSSQFLPPPVWGSPSRLFVLSSGCGDHIFFFILICYSLWQIVTKRSKPVRLRLRLSKINRAEQRRSEYRRPERAPNTLRKATPGLGDSEEVGAGVSNSTASSLIIPPWIYLMPALLRARSQSAKFRRPKYLFLSRQRILYRVWLMNAEKPWTVATIKGFKRVSSFLPDGDHRSITFPCQCSSFKT